MTEQLQATNHSDEIDLKDLIVQLWKKRKFILAVTGLFFLLGIFIAFTLPVEYTAQSVILPQSGRQSSLGNLGSLASIVGVNMGTTVMAEGNISTGIYPQIVNSLPFVREIMETPIVVERSDGKEITLYEYYSEKKYRSKNVFTVIKKYTIGLPGTLISAFRSSKNMQEVTIHTAITPDSTGIVSISRQEQAVYNAIKGSIQYEYNTKEGIIKLGYTFPEPLAAAQISEQLHKSLEKYVINYKIEKVQENLNFVEQSFAEARKDFLQKQANLAAFQDANRGLITASSRTAETRLRSEYDIAFTIYNELAKQREQAQLSMKEEKPILTVINPVTVPLEKSAPRRSMILAVFLLLGLIVSTGWVLAKPFIEDIKAEIIKISGVEG
ncbi:MAG: Wzz/FepE/Etk N-terminal domain-containing protein [Proteiniphilum sp.]|nr:Wzz/FepE/Etk N-terminal domain-containing protein [Proteiniphilum sp.]